LKQLPIMEELKNTFAQCKKEGRVSLWELNGKWHRQTEADGLQPALVTYFTAGYPTPEETVDILLGMEAGGSGMKANWYLLKHIWLFVDVIELGLPFTDPIADGPTIQKSNTVCSIFANWSHV
jgi:tryptophan synthase